MRKRETTANLGEGGKGGKEGAKHPRFPGPKFYGTEAVGATQSFSF